MTPLRQRMLDDMRLRNFSPHTQKSYINQVARFARYFNQSPELLGPEDIRTYQLYLTDECQLSPSSFGITVAALRFLYGTTLEKDWTFEKIVLPKMPRKLPVILSPEEVSHFLDCVDTFKHRTILTTCYAAGLRISEAVSLKPTDIDSQRMVIRVEQGKRQKDRYVMLSPVLLDMLRRWWRVEKPKDWLFPGEGPGTHISKEAVQEACQRARRFCGIRKPITPHSLRHAFAVHLLENGADVRKIQLLLGHRSLETTARYLRIATSKVCSATSPLDLLPRGPEEKPPEPPQS